MADHDSWMGSPSVRDLRYQRLRVMRSFGHDIVAMELAPGIELGAELEYEWESLPPFPYLIQCLGSDEGVLLRFAAIDWNAQRMPISDPETHRIATAGVALTRAFQLIGACVPAHRRHWFTCPFVVVDLEHRPRAGFLMPQDNDANLGRLPPEVRSGWPACGERAYVYAVGQLVLDLVDLRPADVDAPLARVIRRAMHADPERRYRTLADLRAAFVAAGGRRNTDNSVTSAGAWDHVEAGTGFLQTRRWELAGEQFSRALAREGNNARAAQGLEIVRRHSTEPRAAAAPDEPGTVLREIAARSWAEIAPLAAKLEAEHDPRAALSLYRWVKPAADNGVHLGIARTSLALGDNGHAIDYARRARRDDPTSREAFRIEATGLLRHRKHAEALACIETWAAIAPDDGAQFYARGKALLGLSRLPESRDAFDRALALEPTMIEAMLLRREVDRHMKKQRTAVGAQAQAPLDLPPELAGFRDAMVSGHVLEAIALLRTERYAGDPLAQLLLAQLLAYDGEHAEALPIFLNHVDGEHKRVALVGAAECCLALGHSEEALAAANRLDPRKDVVAIELRARAFAQLGRDVEAEAELQRYVAAHRGDVRVRSARS